MRDRTKSKQKVHVFTKSQRNRIYKRALENFLDEIRKNYLPMGVCFQILDSINELYPEYEIGYTPMCVHLKKMFPEFWDEMPKRFKGMVLEYMGVSWWSNAPQGNARRVRALKNCIQKTSPVKRKKKS